MSGAIRIVHGPPYEFPLLVENASGPRRPVILHKDRRNGLWRGTVVLRVAMPNRQVVGPPLP